LGSADEHFLLNYLIYILACSSISTSIFPPLVDASRLPLMDVIEMLPPDV
jgi:hypothetical protein